MGTKHTAKRAAGGAALVAALLGAAIVWGAGPDSQPGDTALALTDSRDIPSTIWFQGFLADEGTGDPVNATYDITARIYDSPEDGGLVWGPEPHNGVQIVEGWFNIELGATEALPDFASPPYYLQLTIDGETLSPRQKLGSVPTAFRAGEADQVGGEQLVVAYHNEGEPVVIGQEPTQYDDCQVTLDVPGAGYVVLHATVTVKFNHTEGINDWLYVGISTEQTDWDAGSYWFSWASQEVPSSWPTDDSIRWNLSTHRVVPIGSPGTYTFYLLGKVHEGYDGGDLFWFAHMSGVYYPDPSVVLQEPERTPPSEKEPGTR